MITENLNEMPVGLSAKGKTAYNAIMKVLEGTGSLDTGGCKTFYSPTEWKARGEEYHLNSELIVVYDGGAVAKFFRYDYDQYDMIKVMDESLSNAGLYSEPATCWYSGVYEIQY